MRRSLLCLFLLVLGAAGSLRADDFTDGNAAFEKGDFPAAVKAYEKAAAKADAGANVYFNLGNAYYRSGQPGKAAVNYERALILAPRHPEAKANLAFLRRQLNALTPEPSALLAPAAALGSDATLIALCLGVWLLLGAAALGLFTRARRAAWAVAGFGLLLAVWAGLSLQALGAGRRALDRLIVIAPKGARATYAPAENARTALNLSPGAEVRLLQVRAVWSYVSLPDGARAWVPSEALERVMPEL